MQIVTESFQALMLILSLAGCGLLAFFYKEQTAIAEEKTSDDVLIQRRIDAIRGKGGVIKLEAKTYIVRQAIVIYDNITIEGVGMDKTIIRLADNANSVLADARMPFVNRCVIRNENYDEQERPQGNHDITIRSLTIDGNAANNITCGEGILLPNCYNYRIENVRVKNCRGFAGIYTNPCHLAARKKIRYRNYILNCIVEEQQHATDRDATYGHGFYVTAWDNDNVLLKGCIARNNKGSGIHGEDFISYFFVEENETYNNGGSGIWFCEVRNSIIKKNKSHHNAGDGIALSQGKGNKNNLVYENDVHHNGNHGISVARQYDAGDSFCSILNNRVWNNESAGIFIADSAGRNTVGFNFCYDDFDTPSAAQSKNRNTDGHRQQYGIVVDSKGNSIINNYVAGNAKGAIKAAEALF
ncbi:MAG: right-handed parallel beta-helix repeat-containing protein [Candidatus Poribacteria bacterium]